MNNANATKTPSRDITIYTVGPLPLCTADPDSARHSIDAELVTAKARFYFGSRCSQQPVRSRTGRNAFRSFGSNAANFSRSDCRHLT
jgi:hypothetical protein